MKPHLAVNLFGFVLIGLVGCTVNYNDHIVDKMVKADTVYISKLVVDNKLEKKVKKLKKTLRFRTYQRDSLQCKLDSFIYSIIKSQENVNSN